MRIRTTTLPAAFVSAAALFTLAAAPVAGAPGGDGDCQADLARLEIRLQELDESLERLEVHIEGSVADALAAVDWDGIGEAVDSALSAVDWGDVERTVEASVAASLSAVDWGALADSMAAAVEGSLRALDGLDVRLDVDMRRLDADLERGLRALERSLEDLDRRDRR